MEAGGLVVNLRGTSDAGKTELVRRLMGLYGGAQVGAAGTALTRHGRTRPIVWVLPHPAGGWPLAVLGNAHDILARPAFTAAGPGHRPCRSRAALAGRHDRWRKRH